MANLRRVRVILSKSDNPNDEPAPAVVADWPRQRHVKYQHVSPDHIAAMCGQTSAIWTGSFVNDVWYLKDLLGDEASEALRIHEAANP